jgi:hypothetical protein
MAVDTFTGVTPQPCLTPKETIMDNETPEWRDGAGMHRVVPEPTKQLEIENPRIAELIHALKIMDQQQQKEPTYCRGLIDSVVTAMAALMRHYREISMSVVRMEAMEKNWQKLHETKWLTTKIGIPKPDSDDVEFDEPATDNKEMP